MYYCLELVSRCLFDVVLDLMQKIICDDSIHVGFGFDLRLVRK